MSCASLPTPLPKSLFRCGGPNTDDPIDPHSTPLALLGEVLFNIFYTINLSLNKVSCNIIRHTLNLLSNLRQCIFYVKPSGKFLKAILVITLFFLLILGGLFGNYFQFFFSHIIYPKRSFPCFYSSHRFLKMQHTCLICFILLDSSHIMNSCINSM